jgi:hypothetical protein
VDGLRPRAHLLLGAAGQVAEALPADGEQRPEHDHLGVLAALHDGVQPGGEGERGLAGAGAPAEGDDPEAGSQSRSRAIRCSAERPRTPNASRSPRTRRTVASAPTRPSAVPAGERSTTPAFTGRSRISSLSADDSDLASPGGDRPSTGGRVPRPLSQDSEAQPVALAR